MAKFSVGKGLQELISELDNLAFDDIAPKMLEESAPLLEAQIKTAASEHVDTGAMAASIKTGKVTGSKDGYHITVAPTGKGPNGVRNMEKMAYLEYGTSKQRATPVLAPAARAAQSSIEEKMQKVFERETKGLKL